MNDTTFQGDGKVVYVPVVVNAKQHKQTNANRIRSMTDAELADWIELLLCPSNCPDEQMGEACARTSCDGCWLSWLKSPVEEVDNG